MRILLIFVISLHVHAFTFEVDTSLLNYSLSSEDERDFFQKRRLISIAAWGMGAAILTYFLRNKREPQYQQYWQLFGVGLLPVLALNEDNYFHYSVNSSHRLATQVRILPMITEFRDNHFVPGVQVCIDF